MDTADIDFSDHYLARFSRRFRPAFGWLPLFLLAGALGCVVLAVLEVKWTEQDRLIVPLAFAGFTLAVVLARRTSQWYVAWALLGLIGITLVLILITEIRPTDGFRWESWSEAGAYIRQALALYSDRVSGWYRAVSGGGSSTDTIVFSTALAVTAFFMAAFLAWSAYRLDRPYLGLTLLGVALGINTYYGRSGVYWVVIFVGLSVTAATYLNYLYRERDWERASVDYSLEVRTDLLIYAAGVSIGIMALAMVLPAINVRAIAEAFQRQKPVVEAGQTLSRAFAGVQQPRTDEATIAISAVLPRGFLLDMAPDLLDTTVMRASYNPVVETVLSPEAAAALNRTHWRSVSFDVYTGRGWLRSPEREELIRARELIPTSTLENAADSQTLEIRQQVEWLQDNRATRYTMGTPERFSHDVAAIWRGLDDLVGVAARNAAPWRYSATSRVPSPSVEVLNQARLEDVPSQVLARYTSLPSGLPARVRRLARDVVDQAALQQAGETAVDESTEPPQLTPYQQALALESFLRQYPYSLDVGRPPADTDMVDYFLFDLQEGFCDYYASAMVVMARSIGLPARLAVGFMPQPADEEGIQVIRQRDAHSWAEIYFAGVGWIEFEPTAPLGTGEVAMMSESSAPEEFGTYVPQPVAPIAIPPPDSRSNYTWPILVAVLAFLAVGWWLWGKQTLAHRRTPSVKLDNIQVAYNRMLAGAESLGYPPRAGQTPNEFTAGFVGHLAGSKIMSLAELQSITGNIEQLARIFVKRQYASVEPNPAELTQAEELGGKLRGTMRRVRWRRWLRHPED